MPTPLTCPLLKPASAMTPSMARLNATMSLDLLEEKGLVGKLFLEMILPEGPTMPNLILVPPTSTPTTYCFIKILNFEGLKRGIKVLYYFSCYIKKKKRATALLNDFQTDKQPYENNF